ncbi:hypothetical protein HYFRA_00003211 [Hymenoscyphus fraxineus]|uniref:Uncharacterized protein n=1 Tax=Hymenoscyphus fraxineus TaxID=746836 RepID=A0A9N9KT64_9HELO|nr:hypothetical protein HYFRA_00003211 [Hymenoscyphus fraxineus]
MNSNTAVTRARFEDNICQKLQFSEGFLSSANPASVGKRTKNAALRRKVRVTFDDQFVATSIEAEVDMMALKTTL